MQEYKWRAAWRTTEPSSRSSYAGSVVEMGSDCFVEMMVLKGCFILSLTAAVIVLFLALCRPTSPSTPTSRLPGFLTHSCLELRGS
ncbi:hypothetical protein ACLOJK_017612 [Asimina triloba]